MPSKRIVHVVFERQALLEPWTGAIEVLAAAAAEVWGPIRFAMVHDYSQRLVQEWPILDDSLADVLARCPGLGPTELLFLYPHDRAEGSVSVHLQRRSLVVSVSRLSTAVAARDTLIVRLWKSVAGYRPLVVLEGEELEIDGDTVVDSPPSITIYPQIDLCDRAIIRRESTTSSEIDGGTLIEVERVPRSS
jgi:hypothetical protein